MKIPALIGLVSGGLLFAASGLRVAAATTNETTAAPAQATSTYSSSAPTKYLPIKSLKKVSYYTQMGANNKKNYNVYKSGAAKTSAVNMKAIAKGSKWANKGFVGDPYKASGRYVYPKGLLKTVKKYGGSSKDLTGASFGTFKKYIKANKPVVVWLTNVDGFPNHAITLTGYSSTRAYYNDPWTKKRTSMKLTSFKSHRKADAYRALSY